MKQVLFRVLLGVNSSFVSAVFLVSTKHSGVQNNYFERVGRLVLERVLLGAPFLGVVVGKDGATFGVDAGVFWGRVVVFALSGGAGCTAAFTVRGVVSAPRSVAPPKYCG